MRIIIADDHKLFREGIRMLLEAEAETEIVAEVDNAEAMLASVKELQPDLVILDYHMPGRGAISSLDYIKKRYPDIKMILLTGIQSRLLYRQLISSCADGVLLKEISAKELLTAIHDVVEGGKAYSASVLNELSSFDQKLTSREFQVLDLVIAGQNSQEIASYLKLSAKTVENHRYRMMQKLEVKNTVELMHYARTNGLL